MWGFRALRVLGLGSIISTFDATKPHIEEDPVFSAQSIRNVGAFSIRAPYAYPETM